MVASPVSPRVGNVKNNDASLIEPARIGHTLNLELMAAEAVTRVASRRSWPSHQARPQLLA
jgi:hypothetical protein